MASGRNHVRSIDYNVVRRHSHVERSGKFKLRGMGKKNCKVFHTDPFSVRAPHGDASGGGKHKHPNN